MHILAVDDDTRILDLLRRGLTYEGYTVDVVEDGAAALTIARDHPPDLVVLDWMLPGWTAWRFAAGCAPGAMCRSCC